MANASLNDLVLDIDVSLAAASVSRAGFGTLLIAGRNATFADRIQFFTTLAAVTDGTGLTSSNPEYYAAREAFANGADRIAIGKMAARVAQVTTFEVTTAADGTWKITIDGVEYSYAASGSATASAIATGLRAAVNAATIDVTAGGSSAIITLTSDIAGRGFTATITVAGAGVATTTATTANVSVGDELDDILSESGDWYGLVLASRTDEDMLQAAAWIEPEGHRIFIAQTSTSGVLSSGSSTDLAAVVEARAYTRTAVLYHATGTEAADAALLARVLSADLDETSTTFDFHRLTGVTADEITTTQRDVALGKQAIVYLPLKGIAVSYGGKAGSGNWLDEVMVGDWLRARIEEDIAQALIDASARGEKIPHDDAGYAVFEAIVRDVYGRGVDAGHFRTNALTLDMDARADVSDADVTARSYSFSGSVGLSGAVRSISFSVSASAA